MTPRRAVIAVAILVMVVAPLFVFGVYLPRFVTRDGGFDRSLCARSEHPVPAPPGHLTVVVVDGLGFEYAMNLEELAWLRRAAAMRPLEVDFPSFTTPALVSFVTGLGPSDSGVRLNAPTRAVTDGLDNIRAAAESVGRPIDFFDGGWEPFGEIMFTDESVLWKGRRAMHAAPFISRSERSLRFIYIGDVDTAGHEHGKSSEAYRVAAVRASEYLKRCHALLGEDDRLMVVSDHGHLPSGGHGGIEPEILRATFALLGRDVHEGQQFELRHIRDVASTIASLAGVPTPACNLGQPMLDMLDLDDRTRLRLQSHVDHQHLLVAAKVEPASDEHRMLRLNIVVAVCLALLLLTRRKLPPLSAWATPLAFIAGYLGFLALRGYRLTFSKMPPQEDFMRDALIGCVIALVSSLAYVRWRRVRGADVALLVGVVAPFLWMNAWVGIDARHVPTAYVGLAILLWSPMLIGASLLSIIAALTRVSAAPQRAETASAAT